MPDKPMTATEVQARMSEWCRRPLVAPDFSSGINVLIRKTKRIALRSALQGSHEDRLRYCLSRATAKPMADLACYGTAEYDPNKLSELAVRWFLRLERIVGENSYG